MRITWLGHACFLLEQDGYRVVIDPFRDVPGFRDVSVEADMVLCSHGHFDHAHTDGITLREGGENPFTVETVETFHDEAGGALRGKNTVHILHAGGLKVVHLGDLGHRLTEEQADVLTCHQNRANVVEVAEAEGIYSIGYHIAPETHSDKNLTTVECRWSLVYEEIIRAYLVGKGNRKDNYWIGLEADAVGLAAYSAEVSEEAVREVEQAKQEILSGWDVFSGKIIDNNGTLRCGEKETISDEVILEQFDWFVEGVRIYEE